MTRPLNRVSCDHDEPESGSDGWAAPRSGRRGSRPGRSLIEEALSHAVQACGGSGGSAFLLDRAGTRLHNARWAWDWTRTGFSVALHCWPSVARAIVTDRAIRLGVGLAEGAEADWFGRNGIQSCIVAPLVGRAAIGVLFVDYFWDRADDSERSVRRAHDIARAWARAFDLGCDDGF